MGERLLGPLGQRFAMDLRLLGRRRGERDRLSSRAAANGGIRSQYRGAFRESHLVAWLLDSSAEPVRMAARLLGHGAAELALDTRALRVVSAGLRVRRR